MFLEKLAKNYSKNLKWYEVSLLKLSVLFFALFLVTAWPAFRNLALRFDWYWYLIIAVLLSVPIIKKILK